MRHADVNVYRFLQDHSIGGLYYPAGTTASTQDVGGTLPFAWVPTPSVRAIGCSGPYAFYRAGPAQSLILQFGTLNYQVAAPKTSWVGTPIPGSPFMSWSLTGLGIGLSPVCA